MATLTYSEEQRVSKIEDTTKKLFHLVKGTGSKKQLNQLLTLCKEQVAEVKREQEVLETNMEELLTLARKLQ
jgi:uncharacterized protein (UPF0335 family)